MSARALTLVSNRSTVVGLLRHLSTRAMQLCEAGAYMHWCAMTSHHLRDDILL